MPAAQVRQRMRVQLQEDNTNNIHSLSVVAAGPNGVSRRQLRECMIELYYERAAARWFPWTDDTAWRGLRRAIVHVSVDVERYDGAGIDAAVEGNALRREWTNRSGAK